MKPLFIQYPKCSTCKRAVAFLKENNIQYDDRDIMIDNPSKEELKKWIDLSGLPIKRFFNSSG
ncbi:MAG TPA: glutaredoxin domain-containing protein, partial [Erysipelothrix sp.]|nr:glutaredoxin domain-containing protein [Erysipelothrix sp.]